MWWLSHIFIAALVFTKLLLDKIYHLIELLFDWCDIDFCLLACWIAFRYCYSYLTWETGRLKLAPTTILVLQAKRLTKCARSFKSRNTSIQKECCVIYIFHSTILIFNVATAWKVSKDGVFLDCILLYSFQTQENVEQKKLRIWTLSLLNSSLSFNLHWSSFLIFARFGAICTIQKTWKIPMEEC